MKDDILDLPMRENDAQAVTVRDYLRCLLSALWLEGEGFSGKRPLGDSGWENDLYVPLYDAGLVDGWEDDGYVEVRNYRLANSIIADAITRL